MLTISIIKHEKVDKGENCNELESSTFLNSCGVCMEIRMDESRFYLKPFKKKDVQALPVLTEQP